MKLWELAGAEDDRFFSPYCWRIRMALAHKGLQAESVPWRFTQKCAIAATGQGAVPVLEDGAALSTALDPLRPVIVQHPYFSGAAPGSAGYILFGAFQWARVVSPTRLLQPDDPLFGWRERMLDLFGGMARQAKGYPVWA